jgi:hypothetical protein
MDLAIFQLRYPERDRRGSFPGEFADVLELFAKPLGFLNLEQKPFGYLGGTMQQTNDRFTDLIDEVRSDVRISELIFGL